MDITILDLWGDYQNNKIDILRLQAEENPLQADWRWFADQYAALGRVAMAAKCAGRAEYYEQLNKKKK